MNNTSGRHQIDTLVDFTGNGQYASAEDMENVTETVLVNGQ